MLYMTSELQFFPYLVGYAEYAWEIALVFFPFFFQMNLELVRHGMFLCCGRLQEHSRKQPYTFLLWSLFFRYSLLERRYQ